MKCKLFDVSPVTFPAYEDTTVALRSYQEHMKQQTELENEPLHRNDEVKPEITNPESANASGNETDGQLKLSQDDLDIRIRTAKAKSKM